MSIIGEVRNILDNEKNLQKAAETIYAGAKSTALYVIQIGLRTIKHRQRNAERRYIKSEERPQFQRGPVTGSIIFTKACRERLRRKNALFFTWVVGDIEIGDFPKEMLVALAAKELATARGNITNAKIYEALAEPMSPGQLVKEYWQPDSFAKLTKSKIKEMRSKNIGLV